MPAGFFHLTAPTGGGACRPLPVSGWSGGEFDSHCTHGCDEAVAPLGYGFDIGGFVSGVPKGLAEQGNVAGQGPFFDEGIGPDGLHQVAFVHHPAGVLNQDQESAGELRRQRHELTAAVQQSLGRIDAIRAELVSFYCWERHSPKQGYHRYFGLKTYNRPVGIGPT